MELSKLEKIAISKLLLEIIYADGKISTSEIKLLLNLQNRLSISNELVEQSKVMKLTDYLAIINEMNKYKKEFVANLIHQMIVADGDINDEEVKVYNKFCEAAELSIPGNELAG